MACVVTTADIYTLYQELGPSLSTVVDLRHAPGSSRHSPLVSLSCVLFGVTQFLESKRVRYFSNEASLTCCSRGVSPQRAFLALAHANAL